MGKFFLFLRREDENANSSFRLSVLALIALSKVWPLGLAFPRAL
jgi:hypothetical protein